MKQRYLLATSLIAAALAANHATATVVNLDSGSGTINGAVFATNFTQPAGTGVFDPFLTVQQKPWEQGYNSSAGDFNTTRNGQWTHEIKLSDLSTTAINGKSYYGFAVDVNEPNGGGQATISLDGLKIWTSSTLQNAKSTDSNGFFNGSLGTLRYNLGTNQVLYTDTHRGSGQADITIWVPVSDFAGVNRNDYVYMYQRWGNTDASQGGFEETALIRGTAAPVPEVNPLFAIVGLAFAVFATHLLRRRRVARQRA